MITTNDLLNTGATDWEEIVNKLAEVERKALSKEFEALAERATMLAVYIEERYGYGCGDQGHKTAVKKMNKALKKIHVGIFGYNGVWELNI